MYDSASLLQKRLSADESTGSFQKLKSLNESDWQVVYVAHKFRSSYARLLFACDLLALYWFCLAGDRILEFWAWSNLPLLLVLSWRAKIS